MLGPGDPQGSLLEPRVMRRQLVTKGSRYEPLADRGHEIVSDDGTSRRTRVDAHGKARRDPLSLHPSQEARLSGVLWIMGPHYCV